MIIKRYIHLFEINPIVRKRIAKIMQKNEDVINAFELEYAFIEINIITKIPNKIKIKNQSSLIN